MTRVAITKESTDDHTRIARPIDTVVTRHVVAEQVARPISAGAIVVAEPSAEQVLEVKARLMAGHSGITAVAAKLRDLAEDAIIPTAQCLLAICDGDTDECCTTLVHLQNSRMWVTQAWVKGAKQWCMPELLVHGMQMARAGQLVEDDA